MGTRFEQYAAIIPSMFTSKSLVPPLSKFLIEQGLARNEENGDIHFTVEFDWSGYQIQDLPANTPFNTSLLEHLIDLGEICLIYEWSFDSGDNFDEEEVWDPVSLAEKIPTLILREVLAKRLESE